MPKELAFHQKPSSVRNSGFSFNRWFLVYSIVYIKVFHMPYLVILGSCVGIRSLRWGVSLCSNHSGIIFGSGVVTVIWIMNGFYSCSLFCVRDFVVINSDTHGLSSSQCRLIYIRCQIFPMSFVLAMLCIINVHLGRITFLQVASISIGCCFAPELGM